MRTLALLLVLATFGCRSEPKPDDTAPPEDTAPAACTDADADGHCEDIDCDDADPEVHPGASEICNGVDDDCDGLLDDQDPDCALDDVCMYPDADADGFGDQDACEAYCELPSGYTFDGQDCDDTDDAVHPDADELCNDVDDDCDGDTDEDAVDVSTWYTDADADGYGDPAATVTGCDQPDGAVDNPDDCDDAQAAINPGASEEPCNGVDDNCDGAVDEWSEEDEDRAWTWYADTDGDGYGDPAGAVLELPECGAPGGYVDSNSDCDDSDASINPAADEYCDGIDTDCSGVADDAYALDATTWYTDADADGYGDATTAVDSCEAGSGHVTDATDCDDTDPSIHPGADEYCNAVDDNCDGTIDEDHVVVDGDTWYVDADVDRYGDPTTGWISCHGNMASVLDGTDCDDSDAAVNPGAAEDSCNDIDDDCDGDIDESDSGEPTELFYADADADGYGDPDDSVEDYPSCVGSGWVLDDSDCDDSDAATYPGADEHCDGVDSDCDGVADLLGYWPFEAGSGTVAYDNGPLALDGDVIDATWTTGYAGGALDFNGSSANVLLDYEDLAPEHGLSLSAWVQPASLQATTYDSVISRGSLGTGDLGCCGDSYWLGYYRYGMAMYNNANTDIHTGELIDSSSHLAHVGGWHHLVGTWESTTGTQAIYVDGALVTTASGPTAISYDGAPTRIGADTNSGVGVLFFDGIIDEVKVLDCAMDATQVATDYTEGWPF
jgi:hypothetical protein